VIAASNQDLHTLVDDGRFRRDLLYRLNIFEVWIPPLRKRPDDIEPLATYFIDVFGDKYGLPGRRLHPDTLRWLREQDWPGNVRELENWIHRELLLADGDEIRVEFGAEPCPAPHAAPAGCADLRSAKARALAEFEAAYLTRTLATAHGNVTVAAKLAGTERRAFGKLLKKYKIDKSQYHS
jgi:DNA-binding NtrC family response regulator